MGGGRHGDAQIALDWGASTATCALERSHVGGVVPIPVVRRVERELVVNCFEAADPKVASSAVQRASANCCTLSIPETSSASSWASGTMLPSTEAASARRSRQSSSRGRHWWHASTAARTRCRSLRSRSRSVGCAQRGSLARSKVSWGPPCLVRPSHRPHRHQSTPSARALQHMCCISLRARPVNGGKAQAGFEAFDRWQRRPERPWTRRCASKTG